MSPEEQKHSGFVPVVMARSKDEAEQYCELLSDHDIPAMVGDDDQCDSCPNGNNRPHARGMIRGVPVLVPEEMLDEAGQVIADREDVDEFMVDSDEAVGDNNDDEEFALGENLGTELVEREDEGDELRFDEEVEEVEEDIEDKDEEKGED